MVCVCSMLTIGSAQAAFAGPSTGYESDMVATVAADLSIYADEDENSEVVAMAEKGESYDVVGKADDSWIKVAAGEMEGYLKVQSSVMLSKAEEAAAVADAFVAEQSNLSTREQLVNYALQFVWFYEICDAARCRCEPEPFFSFPVQAGYSNQR